MIRSFRPSLRHALLAASAGLALAACEAPEEAGETALDGRPIQSAMVTGVFNPADGVDTLAFLPDPDAPWTGLLAATLEGGGFDVYTIDGDRIIQAGGPRLRSLAAAPVFELRGERFPLLLGPDNDGAVRGFVMLVEGRDVVEIPLAAEELASGVAGMCLYRQGIGYLDIAVLRADARAEVWRLTDQGQDALALERREAFALPFPARACAAAEGDIVVSGPGAGLARVTTGGDVTASVSGADIPNLVHVDLMGRDLVVASLASDGLLGVYDARSLEPLSALELESGINAPALERPGAIAVSEESYGGMAFSSGIMAIYDANDARIKLVAREVISQAVTGRRSDPAAEAES
jgi:hypothetical protein